MSEVREATSSRLLPSRRGAGTRRLLGRGDSRGRSGARRNADLPLRQRRAAARVAAAPLQRRDHRRLRPHRAGGRHRRRRHPHGGRARRRRVRHQRQQGVHHQLGHRHHRLRGRDGGDPPGLRAGGAPEISAVIVPSGTPGFSVAAKYSKVGWSASDTHELSFVDCRVPAGNLLGEEGRGYAQFLEILDEGRVAIAALATGLAQGCVDDASATSANARRSGAGSASTRRSASRSPTWRRVPTPPGSPTGTPRR